MKQLIQIVAIGLSSFFCTTSVFSQNEITIQEINEVLEKADSLIDNKHFEIALDLLQETKLLTIPLVEEYFEQHTKICSEIASCHRGVFDYASEQKAYLEAYNVAKEYNKDKTIYGQIAISLATSYREVGDFKQAKQYYEEGNELVKDEHPAKHAEGLEGLSIVYVMTGDFATGSKIAQSALKVTKEKVGLDGIEYQRRLQNLGTMSIYTEEFDQAEKCYLEVLSILKAKGEELSLDYAMVILNMGALYGKMEQIERAGEHFEKAMIAFKKGGHEDHPSYANSMRNLASVKEMMGEYEAAQEICKEVYVLQVKAFGEDSPRMLAVLRSMGRLQMKTGVYEGAEKALKEVITICENNEDLNRKSIDHSEAIIELVDLYHAQGELVLAEQYVAEYLDITEGIRGKQSKYYITNKFTQGEIFAKQAKLEEASMAFHEANTLCIDFLKKTSKYSSEEDFKLLIDFFSRKGFDLYHRFAESNANIDLAVIDLYNNALYLKNALLKGKVHLKNKVEQADGALLAEYQNWEGIQSQLSEAYTSTDTPKSLLDSLETTANALEKRLVKAIPDFDEAWNVPDWKQVQAALNEGEVVVEFFAFKDLNESMEYGAVLVKKESAIPEVVSLFTIDELMSLRNSRKLYAFSENEEKKNLYQAIWQPLEKHLEAAQKVYFSPVGVLHKVNLNAIPVNAANTLADKFDLQRISTSRSLVSDINTGNAIASASIFGGLNYSLKTNEPTTEIALSEVSPFQAAMRSYRGGDWEYLSWSDKEVKMISNLLKKQAVKTKVYSKNEGTEEVFKSFGKTNSSPSVLHLATHGYFFPNPKEAAQTGFQSSQNPLIRSGLILAGANHVWQGNAPVEGKEDGILTAYEIAQMDLSNTELVVLSACETGLGDLEGNEGVYGLQRAFKMAGVKYVMMSLWSVQDKQTKEFMELFYSEWLDNNKSIPEAHLAAQNAMRLRYAKPFNPNLWAGFVLVQ